MLYIFLVEAEGGFWLIFMFFGAMNRRWVDEVVVGGYEGFF